MSKYIQLKKTEKSIKIQLVLRSRQPAYSRGSFLSEKKNRICNLCRCRVNIYFEFTENKEYQKCCLVLVLDIKSSQNDKYKTLKEQLPVQIIFIQFYKQLLQRNLDCSIKGCNILCFFFLLNPFVIIIP